VHGPTPYRRRWNGSDADELTLPRGDDEPVSRPLANVESHARTRWLDARSGLRVPERTNSLEPLAVETLQVGIRCEGFERRRARVRAVAWHSGRAHRRVRERLARHPVAVYGRRRPVEVAGAFACPAIRLSAPSARSDTETTRSTPIRRRARPVQPQRCTRAELPLARSRACHPGAGTPDADRLALRTAFTAATPTPQHRLAARYERR
jgi:hypothetical protein